jgi:hypothetical protein
MHECPIQVFFYLANFQVHRQINLDPIGLQFINNFECVTCEPDVGFVASFIGPYL